MKYTKFARTLPREHRNTPFVDAPEFPKMQPWEKKAWAGAVGFWLTIVYLNPFGWSW